MNLTRCIFHETILIDIIIYYHHLNLYWLNPSFASPLICLCFDVTLTRLFGYCFNMRFPVVVLNLSSIPYKKLCSMPWFSWPATWKHLLVCYLDVVIYENLFFKMFFNIFPPIFGKIFQHYKLPLIFHLKRGLDFASPKRQVNSVRS